MSAHTTQHRFALRFRSFAAIDRAAGIVRGVSVITIGDAKGHGLQVDETTLAQVQGCAQSYQGGLKVKMEHRGGAGDIVGFLTNFRREGTQLLADLNLLKSSPHREYILELAETIPDTFGLSISFSGPVEDKDGVRFARCVEIYSADLVAEPAANPSGLFEIGTISGNGAQAPAPQPNQNKSINMDENKIKDMIDCAVKAAVESLSARLSKLETPPAAPVPAPEEQEKAMQAKLAETAELAAKNALTAFMATLGTPPAAPSAEPAKPAAKKFEELVREHAEYSKNKAAAIKAVVKSNPAEYADYSKRLGAGEVIMF
jgi:hypothetical protein